MKKNIRTKFIGLFTLVLILGAAPSVLWSATLHAVIVTDQDPTIGSSKDRVLVSDLVDQIGRMTQMEVNKKMFYKTDQGIVEYVQRLNPEADDVIWFYYSGHGRNAGDGFPLFYANGMNFKLTAIHRTLKTKSARLKISMFDSCNIGTTENAWARTNGLTPTALGVLFKESSGTIIASGAGAGQYGYGSPMVGGIFTTSLIRAMGELDPNGQHLWKTLLDRTRVLSNEACVRLRRTPQNPIYDLDLQNGGACTTPPVAAPEKQKFNTVDAF